jgi:CRP-like cAMP-binding protein
MLKELLNVLKREPEKWEIVRQYFHELKIPAKEILLSEGEYAVNVYFIVKGCLRMWCNNDGKDITTQFFFENQAVSSMESFFGNQPSLFYLESIEPCELLYLSKNDVEKFYEYYPILKDGFYQIMLKRLFFYAKLFITRIRDNPTKRYLDLIKEHPEIVRRVPQHYIASYLGITPISLSRIRKKISSVS